jgi:hypothetical protein
MARCGAGLRRAPPCADAGFVVGTADAYGRGMGPVPTLEWTAPAGCPDASQVRAAVANMLDAASWNRAPAGMMARGTVTETDDGRFLLRTQVGVGEASETQTIESDACAKLADAYAVIVAFAIDPGARAREDRPGPGPQLAPPAHAELANTPRARATRGVVGPLAAVGAGFLPFPAVGVGARIRIESTLWWELAGTYWPQRQASVAVVPATTIEAHITLVSVEPGICLPFMRGAAAVCAGAELGEMPADGTGMAKPGAGSSWWLAPDLAAVLRAPVLHFLDLGLRLELGVPLLRPSFVAQNVGSRDQVVFQPSEFFGILSVEAAVPFFSTESAEAGHVRR